MFKRKIVFTFLYNRLFKFLNCLTVFALIRGQSGHSILSLSETLLTLNYGQVSFKSSFVYCSCLFTEILNYTSDKLAKRRLLKKLLLLCSKNHRIKHLN